MAHAAIRCLYLDLFYQLLWIVAHKLISWMALVHFVFPSVFFRMLNIYGVGVKTADSFFWKDGEASWMKRASLQECGTSVCSSASLYERIHQNIQCVFASFLFKCSSVLYLHWNLRIIQEYDNTSPFSSANFTVAFILFDLAMAFRYLIVTLTFISK